MNRRTNHNLDEVRAVLNGVFLEVIAILIAVAIAKYLGWL